MNGIVKPEIFDYITDLHSPKDEAVLIEMEALAHEQDFPIIGRSAGAFIEVMAQSIRAKRIFEFGSGYGYSAFWFSRAVQPDGKVICTEGDTKNCALAKEYLQRVNRWQQIEYHNGWAQDIFKQQTGEFDLIFCDADKGDYPEIWQLAKTKLRTGGIYIADNCLWYGRVVLDVVTDDIVEGWTDAIKEHNEMIAHDPDFNFFINPIRDGLICAIKK